MTPPPLVLVVRIRDHFSILLEAKGFRVINLQTINTRPLDDLTHLYEELDRIDGYAGIFFTSAVAAEVFVEAWRAGNFEFRGEVYALGIRARSILEKAGFRLAGSGEANTSEELIRSVDPQDLDQKKFLYVCGDMSLRTIPDLLRDRSEVRELVVYKTVPARPENDVLATVTQKLSDAEIDWICFFSPSGVECFMDLIDAAVIGAAKVAAIGTTTAQAVKRAGLPLSMVSERSTAEGFAASLTAQIRRDISE